MKRTVIILILLICLVSCTSVIRKDLIEQGTRNPSLAELIRDPEMYRNRIFILGGVVARTTLKPEGSEIEALYIPVDSFGYPQETGISSHRFLAVYPREQGVLDPLIYQKDRVISIAGTFTGVVASRLDEMEYVFPHFRITQIYLQPKKPAMAYYYYPPPYGGPLWWGYPWGPW